MAKKKKSQDDAARKKSRARITKLEAQLAAAEKSAGKWKARAQKHRSDAAALKSELSAVRRRASKAEASAAKWKDRAKGTPVAPTASAAPVAPEPGASGPDDSWTVTRLRAEARTRGVAGYSRKTKAQLLSDLSG